MQSVDLSGVVSIGDGRMKGMALAKLDTSNYSHFLTGAVVSVCVCVCVCGVLGRGSQSEVWFGKFHALVNFEVTNFHGLAATKI